MQAKTIRGSVLVGVFGALVVVRFRPQTVRFAGKTLRITVLVYCNLAELAQCAPDLESMRSDKPSGLGVAIKRFYEGEFQRVTGATTLVDVKIVAPKAVGAVAIEPPTGLPSALVLYKRLMHEFSARGESFWRADARVFLVIARPGDVAAAPRESSVGSSQGRIGLIDWQAGAQGSDLVWCVLKTLHELGHIFGAHDHYLEDGHSAYPEGFVEPDRAAQEPQRYIDVMSGTRPMGSGAREAPPKSLSEVRVSPTTASELGWK